MLAGLGEGNLIGQQSQGQQLQNQGQDIYNQMGLEQLRQQQAQDAVIQQMIKSGQLPPWAAGAPADAFKGLAASWTNSQEAARVMAIAQALPDNDPNKPRLILQARLIGAGFFPNEAANAPGVKAPSTGSPLLDMNRRADLTQKLANIADENRGIQEYNKLTGSHIPLIQPPAGAAALAEGGEEGEPEYPSPVLPESAPGGEPLSAPVGGMKLTDADKPLVDALASKMGVSPDVARSELAGPAGALDTGEPSPPPSGAPAAAAGGGPASVPPSSAPSPTPGPPFAGGSTPTPTPMAGGAPGGSYHAWASTPPETPTISASDKLKVELGEGLTPGSLGFITGPPTDNPPADTVRDNAAAFFQDPILSAMTLGPMMGTSTDELSAYAGSKFGPMAKLAQSTLQTRKQLLKANAKEDFYLDVLRLAEAGAKSAKQASYDLMKAYPNLTMFDMIRHAAMYRGRTTGRAALGYETNPIWLRYFGAVGDFYNKLSQASLVAGKGGLGLVTLIQGHFPQGADRAIPDPPQVVIDKANQLALDPTWSSLQAVKNLIVAKKYAAMGMRVPSSPTPNATPMPTPNPWMKKLEDRYAIH